MFDLLEQKPRVLAALSRNDTQMRKTHHVNAFSQKRGDGKLLEIEARGERKTILTDERKWHLSKKDFIHYLIAQKREVSK